MPSNNSMSRDQTLYLLPTNSKPSNSIDHGGSGHCSRDALAPLREGTGSLGVVSRRTPSEVCRAYLAAFGIGNPDAVTSLVTDDFVNEHTAALGGGCVGKAEYVRRVPGFLASMPGLR